MGEFIISSIKMSKKEKAISNPFSSKVLKTIRKNMLLWLESIKDKIPARAYDNYEDKIMYGRKATIQDLFDNVSV